MADARTREEYAELVANMKCDCNAKDPEMEERQVEERHGKDTTEFRQAKSSGRVGLFAMILGGIVAIGPAILPFLSGTPAAPVAGAAIVIAGVLQKTVADVSYIRSRTDVKVKRDRGR